MTMTIPREEVACINCKHYYQHWGRQRNNPYINSVGEFFPLDKGHCVKPRMKDRRPGDMCIYFERRIGE